MIRGGETSAARQAGLDCAVAAGAIAARLSGDRDEDAALAAGLNGSEPGPVLDLICRPSAAAMFAARGRRGLHQDRAGITYVQISALAEPDAAAPAVPLRSRRIRICGSGAGSVLPDFVLAQLPALMQLIAGGRVQVPARTAPLPQIAQARTAVPDSASRVVVVPGWRLRLPPTGLVTPGH